MSWTRISLACGALSLVASLACVLPACSGGADTSIGARAPEISAADLKGNSFKLSEYRGMVVLLDFWGDW